MSDLTALGRDAAMDAALELTIAIGGVAYGAQEHFCYGHDTVEGKGGAGSYHLIYHAATTLLDYLNKIDMEGLPARK